jgi:predicted metal-dependent hydrolase
VDANLHDVTLEDDPRFLAAIAQFNAGQYYDAGDGFEELFFEAVRDELEFVRVFLQVAVGAYHADCGQRRPAVERLEEAILAIDRVANDRGFDLGKLRADVAVFIGEVAVGRPAAWPRVTRRAVPGA